MESIGYLLLKERKDKNISKRELARRIGISHTYVCKLEKNKKIKCGVLVLLKLAKYFKLNTMDLLCEYGYSKEEINLIKEAEREYEKILCIN